MRMKTPYISIELLEYLKGTFPNSVPMSDDVDLGMVKKMQGIQTVINLLEATHKKQQKMD